MCDRWFEKDEEGRTINPNPSQASEGMHSECGVVIYAPADGPH